MTTGLLDYRKGRGEGIHALGKHSRLRYVLDYFIPGDMSADARFAPCPILLKKINAN